MSRPRQLTVVLTVEPKDEYEGGQVTGLPPAGSVVSRIQDILADTTKHDETIGWRITKVVSAR